MCSSHMTAYLSQYRIKGKCTMKLGHCWMESFVGKNLYLWLYVNANVGDNVIVILIYLLFIFNNYRFHLAIFAYGQTGSGKTFTLDGTEQNPGILRRALKDLFAI